MIWKNRGITQFRNDLTSVVSNIINCIENRAFDKESINTVERLQECYQLRPLTVHRGAFCQFPFWWIYYYGSNKSTGKETGKTQLCALVRVVVIDNILATFSQS